MASDEPVAPVEAEGQERPPNPLSDALEVMFGLLAPAIAAGQGLAPTVRRVSNWGPVRGVAGAAGRTLDGWRVRGRTEQKRFLDSLDEFVRQTMPQIIEAIFDRIDVNEILARVDLDRLISQVDLDAAMSRIDLNELMARVDFDAMMERIDIGKLTNRLMEEIDLRQIMRESTSSITSEAVDAVRVQGMNADRFVDRLVDRLLFRKTARDLAGPVVPAGLGELEGGPSTNGQDPVTTEGGEDGDAGRLGVAASENEG
jgi:hypothetical protein